MAALVFSCEHASAWVPKRWHDVLDPRSSVLSSHRAYDLGAQELATFLARQFRAPLFTGQVTRLLVDLNRPLHHPRVFPQTPGKLSNDQKQRLATDYHAPYWQKVSEEINEHLRSRELVVHLSVHTFTPRLGRQTRTADIGLLYDPNRSREAKLCTTWQRYLAVANPALRVRRNYPYRGTSAGLTSSLRSSISSAAYLGIELEVSQRWVEAPRWPKQLGPTLAYSLQRAVSQIQ